VLHRFGIAVAGPTSFVERSRLPLRNSTSVQSRPWRAEIRVDEPLARRLIEGATELRTRSLRLLAVGWDNVVWVADEQWAFRFPQRELGVPGFRRELAVLPRLASLLPLPVPVPVYVGEPVEWYPWPFSGARLLRGRELCDARLDAAARTAVARPLARFLRRLHSREVADAPGADALPLDVNHRADMAARTHVARSHLADIERMGIWRAPTVVGRVLEEALELPPPEPPVLVHGDLHFRHVLVDGGGVTGIVDWGDVCRADPAVDLSLVWSYFPPAGREAFLDEYGDVTEAQAVRGQVLGLSLCAALARYGRDEGFVDVERDAVAGLDRIARGLAGRGGGTGAS